MAACVAASVVTIQGLPDAARAADPSGTVIAMTPAAVARGAVGERRLSVNASVFMGDSIATSALGEAQILLIDDTKLVVGPRSAVVIDEFVINSSGAAHKVTLNAVRGAFRFITGSGRKQAYRITTPTATIGIRGTKFDFTIDADGSTSIALFEGEAEFCDRRRRNCVQLESGCSIASVAPRQDPRLIESIQQQRDIIDDLFPFIRSQRRLRSEFQIASASNCEIRRARLPSQTEQPINAPVVANIPPNPDPDPVITGSIPGNPGNDKAVGGSGDKFGGSGSRGKSGK